MARAIFPNTLRCLLHHEDTKYTFAGEEYTGRKAFVVNQNSVAMLQRALKWACGYSRSSKDDFAYELRYTPRVHALAERVKVQSPVWGNDIRIGLRILSLEIRSEGGRAWKVMDDNGYIFDLRESELQTLIEQYGVETGGYSPCMYRFGVNGAHTKLLICGSDEYAKYEEE